MMRKVIFVVLAISMVFVVGCGSTAGRGGVGLGEEFSLSIGQKTTITGENLEITFLKVLEDSRCPKGVQCIWAGRATSLVSIVSNNTTDIELAELGLTDQANRQIFRDLQIVFHLLPYPEVGKLITDDQYRLQMTVSKQK